MTKILGITDERTTCECCGKEGLKRTIVIEFSSEIRYYGTTCAAKALNFVNPERYTSRNAESLVNDFGKREVARERRARAIESAQAQANKWGEPVSVLRKEGRYSTMLSSHYLAMNNPSWGYEVEVLQPQVVNVNE